MNIINEFFVSFILIKLYFKFKVCRKIKFPLLWKFYFSKWKFYFSADILEELSAGMLLKAGSIISMGTPSGVGMGLNPPTFLKSGDKVRCVIENLGELCNKIKNINY